MAVKSLQPYPDYLPPDFSSDFLLGRQRYFHGAYQWAFYPHIAAGPVTLILGTLLVSATFRRRVGGASLLPKWQGAVVDRTAHVTETGECMARHEGAMAKPQLQAFLDAHL